MHAVTHARMQVKAVDTNGAGDTFATAYMLALAARSRDPGGHTAGLPSSANSLLFARRLGWSAANELSRATSPAIRLCPTLLLHAPSEATSLHLQPRR